MTSAVSLPLIGSPFNNGFLDRLKQDGQSMVRTSLETLQLNLGKMCNLACHHCHVEAGPKRTEIMTREVMVHIIDWIDKYQDEMSLKTIDLTGGAPEMNPDFRFLVTALKERGFNILDRCNLTILLEPGYEDLAQFLADHEVEIVASLPCYLEDNVDGQRGKGVFQGSIDALKLLNQHGYGIADESGREKRKLDLVYNPTGYGLPGSQEKLEAAYKAHLDEHYGVKFSQLYTITNMPIKRFEHALRRDGELNNYMHKLMNAHGTSNVNQVMCRSLVSIGWEGSVYDCDFNQMLQMPLDGELFGDEHEVERHAKKLWAYTPSELVGRDILSGNHCFGCTAGSGSSCTGALV